MASEFEQFVIEKLSAIHDQTLKTNGRVTALESWRRETEPKVLQLDAWKNRMAGGIAVIIVMVLPVIVESVKGMLK